MTKISISKNHFLDTNVILRFANNQAGSEAGDIDTIIRESIGITKTRQIWVSSVLFAELRPSNLVQEKFSSVEDLSGYIQSLATVVTADVNTMMRAAKFRDLFWSRADKSKLEKPRRMSLGDAIHIASALWVKEVVGVADLEFLTFDDGKSASVDGERKEKPLSLLRLHEYTDGLGNNSDVTSAVLLRRIPPILSKQHSLLP